MSRGSDSQSILNNRGFQPVLRGLQGREKDQLSELNDGHILVAFRLPRDPDRFWHINIVSMMIN
jgi:hypothetical protein